MSQLCVQCSLENKDMLTPEELSSVRDYASRHGIKFRGSNSFPQFMEYRPAVFPTRAASEEHIKILVDALRAVLAVNERLLNAESEKKSLGFSNGMDAARTLPVLTQGEDGFIWSTDMLPEATDPSYPRPVLQDEILLTRLKKTKKRNTTWVCDVVMCPQPVQEGNAAPVFPYTLLAADKETGIAVKPAMVYDYEKEAGKLLRHLGEKMLESCVPRRMVVTDDRTHAFLEAFTGSLGIKLVLSDEDDLLENLEEEFALFLMNDGDYGMNDEDMAQLAAGLLMNLDEEELLQLPQDAWEGLWAMINGGDFPAEVGDRFRELDRKRRKR